MKSYQDQLSEINLTVREGLEYQGMCITWECFCQAVSNIEDSHDMLRIIAFLKRDRPSAKMMMQRAVERFNRLNRLKAEDVL